MSYSNICDTHGTCRIHTYVTHTGQAVFIYTWQGRVVFIYVWLALFICVWHCLEHALFICYMGHARTHTWHAAFIWHSWHSRIHVWHVSFMCVKIRAYVWHDSVMRDKPHSFVTSLIFVLYTTLTDLYVVCRIHVWHMLHVTLTNSYLARLIHVWHMYICGTDEFIYSCVPHSCLTWFVHTCDMSHSYDIVDGNESCLQHTAIHCNAVHTLQHAATQCTHCNTLQHTAHTATHCNTLHTAQHTATHCTHCNTLQHTAHTARRCNTVHTHCKTLQQITAHGYHVIVSGDYYGVATISRLLNIISLFCRVSFAKDPYKRHDILQKRPTILRSLLTVATP